MEYKKYRVGDLKERIRENAERSKSMSKISVLSEESVKQEFEPVFGKNVPKDNKKINNDAYKEISKETGTGY